VAESLNGNSAEQVVLNLGGRNTRNYECAEHRKSLATFEAETRFRAMAAKGSIEKGLAVPDKLDNSFVI